MNRITDTHAPAPAFFARTPTGGPEMLKRFVSAIRRATGIHPRRRWDDFDGATCAADVINRSMLEIATRTHGPDIISRMRDSAEKRRRHDDEPQLHLFPQEDNP